MFESVAPGTFEPRSRRLFYETLPLSLAIHAVGVGAALAAAVWNVGFPTASPRVSVAYNLARIPEPPPPPPAPKAPKPEPVQATLPPPPPPKLAEIVAPTVIPDTIPEVIAIPDPIPPPLVEAAPAIPAGGGGGEPGGDVAGKARGKGSGIVFRDDGRVHVERDVKLPMESVEREFPIYPPEGQKRRLEDQVILRYVIGTNGRVKEVEIIAHAAEKMFDDAAVEAIRRWRYRPLIKDGKAVEVVHELAVNFELILR